MAPTFYPKLSMHGMNYTMPADKPWAPNGDTWINVAIGTTSVGVATLAVFVGDRIAQAVHRQCRALMARHADHAAQDANDGFEDVELGETGEH